MSKQLNSGSIDRIPPIWVVCTLLTARASAHTSDSSILVDIKHRFPPMVQSVVNFVIFLSDQPFRITPKPLQGQESCLVLEFLSPSSRLSALAWFIPIDSLVTC